ncbi:queuosine salvage family protein [Acidithrix sp. C25]|uniref:queuosine salvage family protein n=1 Tax=Acidithrix sp. C25 TaxID=1671482 RepID=UPI00191B98E0|nr:queuosine salvage family protein [Acidithrix sp. C25]
MTTRLPSSPNQDNSAFVTPLKVAISPKRFSGTSDIRSGAKELSLSSSWVTINEAHLNSYSDRLLQYAIDYDKELDPRFWILSDPIASFAFVIVVDYLNFGSGYFKDLQKNSTGSGYLTFAQGLTSYFVDHYPFKPSHLTTITSDQMTEILQQRDPSPQVSILIDLLVKAVNELGMYLEGNFADSFVEFAKYLNRDVDDCLKTLIELPALADYYEINEIAFYPLKKAQIILSDLDMIWRFHHKNLDVAQIPFCISGIHKLTAFADNSLPHVLRVEKVLEYDPALESHIQLGGRLEYSSWAEVEIRAATIQSVEMIHAKLLGDGITLYPNQIDAAIWTSKHDPLLSGKYRLSLSHKCKSIFY